MTNGHNSGDLSPAEHKALYMHHFRGIEAQTSVVKSANEERKRLRKLAKADGIPLKDIDFGLRCSEIEDNSIIADEMIRHSQIAQFFALPVGVQTNMDFEAEPIVDRAKREGMAAGYAGKDRVAPYEDSSKPGQAWLKEFDKGKAAFDRDHESALAKIKAKAEREAADDGANDPDDETDSEADADADPDADPDAEGGAPDGHTVQ